MTDNADESVDEKRLAGDVAIQDNSNDLLEMDLQALNTGVSISDDAVAECQERFAEAALSKHCWTVHMHFNKPAKLPDPRKVPGTVHLVIDHPVTVTSPWNAFLNYVDLDGNGFRVGEVTIWICDEPNNPAEAAKQALRCGARDRETVLVDPAWPLYTAFLSPQSYMQFFSWGAWTMERVLRAVSDLTYAQATEYRPVWYEDAHASLFEDPTEIGAQFDDATEDVYRIFRTANFKRESERQGHAESLRSIRCGREDATAFELWVKGALQLLFGHTLEAIELKPNGANATRRDIVARNNGTGTGSFFARLLNDYGARLQVFEVKNYAESTAGDFQQVRGYLNRPHYGDIGFLVTHSSTLEVSEANWNQIREVYNGGQERKLVLVLPSELLIRWLKYSSCQPEGKFDKEMHAWLDECLLKHLPD